jgi:LysM repeat protein
VLAEQLVSFPTPAKRIFLEQTSPGRERSRDGRGDRPDADGARSYGEAWLERELLAIRYRADAGYPALETRPSSASRAVAGEQLDPELAPAGDVYRSDPERRGRVARELAAQTRAGAAAEPRGLRRLLPGVATLAALAGLWAGAGMLAAGQRPALAVLPGSVKTQAGYVYVVRPGDTLWSIATRLRPGGDPRVIVAQLESQVGGGTLVPGSRLVLP